MVWFVLFWLFFSLDNFFTEIILSRQLDYRLRLNDRLEIWDVPLYKIILSRELFIKPRAIWSPHNFITPFWQTSTNHYILELTLAWLYGQAVLNLTHKTLRDHFIESGPRLNMAGRILPFWVAVWLVISSIVVTIDALFVLLRPHTLPDGKWNFLFEPCKYFLHLLIAFRSRNFIHVRTNVEFSLTCVISSSNSFKSLFL